MKVRTPEYVRRRDMPSGLFPLCCGLLLVCGSCANTLRARGPQTASPSPTQPAADRRAAFATTSKPTPTPGAPLPALERGTDAFTSSLSLCCGRRFETRAIEKRLTRNKFEVGAEYPRLVGDGSRAAAGFNRAVYRLVSEDIGGYLIDERDPEKEKLPFWKDTEEFHRLSHKIVFASDDLISVLFYAQGYSWGAAHGYHRPLTLNYDLKRGRVLKLADLFKRGSNYLPALTAYCAGDLKRQFGDRFRPLSDGLRPTPKTYRAWVLTPEGLAVVFEEYQIAAYADGEPKVLIPYYELKELADPHGALAPLLPPG